MSIYREEYTDRDVDVYASLTIRDIKVDVYVFVNETCKLLLLVI